MKTKNAKKHTLLGLEPAVGGTVSRQSLFEMSRRRTCFCHYHPSSLNGVKSRHLDKIFRQFRLQSEHKNVINLY